MFIEAQISVFLATANAEGQPYIQHRGGPPGFLRVLDDQTIGFADFRGNRQYITQGNLADNAKAHLFLIDYTHKRRVKIWGTARVVEGDAELIAKLMPKDYKARPEQAILFTVSAWDANCEQHIPVRYEEADVDAALAEAGRRLAALEAEVKRLRELTAKPGHDRGIDDHLSRLRASGDRAHVCRRLPVFLSLQRLRGAAQAQAGRLLCVLLLRFSALPADPGETRHQRGQRKT